MRKNEELKYSFKENIMVLTSKLEKENKELYEIYKVLIWWERLKNFFAPVNFSSSKVTGTQIIFKKIESNSLEYEIQRLNFYIFQFNQIFNFKFPEITWNEILGVKIQIKNENNKE